MTSENHNHINRLISSRRHASKVRVAAIAYGNLDLMRKPRVQYLMFELLAIRSNFKLPSEPRGDPFTLGDFDCTWRDAKLRADPRILFATWTDAESAITPHLQTWAAWAELTGYGPIEFRLRHWTVNDTDPPEGQSPSVVATMSDDGFVRHTPEEVRRENVPALPPSDFATSPIIEELRDRLRLVRDYISNPLVEGNYLLTAIARIHGDRTSAASAMNVDRAVLGRLGELCSRYSLKYGRKFPKAHEDERPLEPGDEA